MASRRRTPTIRAFSSPSTNSNRVGIENTPNRPAVLGLLSTFSLPTLSLLGSASAIASTSGATMWQGWHHSAQKSSSTGASEPDTSASKLSSLISVIPAIMSSGCESPSSSRIYLLDLFSALLASLCVEPPHKGHYSHGWAFQDTGRNHGYEFFPRSGYALLQSCEPRRRTVIWMTGWKPSR